MSMAKTMSESANAQLQQAQALQQGFAMHQQALSKCK
jgi:hypothetical protein